MYQRFNFVVFLVQNLLYKKRKGVAFASHQYQYIQMVVKLIIITMRNWCSTIVATLGSFQVILTATTWASKHYSDNFVLLQNANFLLRIRAGITKLN